MDPTYKHLLFGTAGTRNSVHVVSDTSANTVRFLDGAGGYIVKL